jgi:tetratricopeptide (TPR) repeat protein
LLVRDDIGPRSGETSSAINEIKGIGSMPSLMVLSCPVCGAPLATDSSRCGYCGSVVVIQTDLPRLESHQLNKAVIHEHIGKYRSAVRQDNNDETAHYGLGLAYFNLGLLEEAGEELAQAARLMPENPHIQVQLAVVYAELAKSGKTGFEDLAWDRLKRVFLLDPKLPGAFLLKADLHLRHGDWKNAVSAWRKAAAEEPDCVRKPIAAFLTRHKRIFAVAPQFRPTKTSKRKRRPPRSYRHIWLALASVFGFFLLTGILANIPILPYITLLLTFIAPFVIYFKLRPKPSPKEPNHDQMEEDFANREQREFLAGAISDASRMVNAAAYVADQLVHEEKQREFEEHVRQQQARRT